MDRYSRQIAYIGEKSQGRLSKSKAAIIGLGATGSMAAAILTRAGLGSLRLIDRDFVDESNLHRAFLFNEHDIDKSKAGAAKEKLMKEDASCVIESFCEDLNPKTLGLLGSCDIILDCTDNMKTRFLVNEFSVKNKTPWIYCAATGAEAMAASFSGSPPCFKCLFPRMPSNLETCETLGILSPASSIIASWQALEAMRILAGFSEPSYGKLFHFNLESNDFSFSGISNNSKCPVCIKKEFEMQNSKDVISLCGRDSYQVLPAKDVNLNLMSLGQRLGKNKFYRIRLSGNIIHLFHRQYKISIFQNSRAIIHGAKSDKEAKSLYSRILGV